MFGGDARLVRSIFIVLQFVDHTIGSWIQLTVEYNWNLFLRSMWIIFWKVCDTCKIYPSAYAERYRFIKSVCMYWGGSYGAKLACFARLYVNHLLKTFLKTILDFWAFTWLGIVFLDFDALHDALTPRCWFDLVWMLEVVCPLVARGYPSSVRCALCAPSSGWVPVRLPLWGVLLYHSWCSVWQMWWMWWMCAVPLHSSSSLLASSSACISMYALICIIRYTRLALNASV